MVETVPNEEPSEHRPTEREQRTHVASRRRFENARCTPLHVSRYNRREVIFLCPEQSLSVRRSFRSSSPAARASTRRLLQPAADKGAAAAAGRRPRLALRRASKNEQNGRGH